MGFMVDDHGRYFSIGRICVNDREQEQQPPHQQPLLLMSSNSSNRDIALHFRGCAVMRPRRRMIHSTASAWNKASKAEAKAKAKAAMKAREEAEAAAANEGTKKPSEDESKAADEDNKQEKAEEDDDDSDDDDDEIPVWQNPRHHNDPNADKIFEEDFAPGEEMPIVPLPPLDDGSGKVLARPHLREIADEILNLSLLEIKELVDRISEQFGFEDRDIPIGGVAGGGGGGAAAAPEEKEEEKTAFDLKLESFDAKAKIKVIKEVRAISGLGLKEAKDLVEGAPKIVKKDLKKEEAEELKQKLEGVGATVEIV